MFRVYCAGNIQSYIFVLLPIDIYKMRGYFAEIQEPHLRHILEGEKTVEGRLDRGKWSDMEPGDTLHIHAKGSNILHDYTIVQVVHAVNFQELYNIFEDALLPKVTDCEDAADVYREWFSDAEVKEHGVVGVVIRQWSDTPSCNKERGERTPRK